MLRAALAGSLTCHPNDRGIFEAATGCGVAAFYCRPKLAGGNGMTVYARRSSPRPLRPTAAACSISFTALSPACFCD